MSFFGDSDIQIEQNNVFSYPYQKILERKKGLLCRNDTLRFVKIIQLSLFKNVVISFLLKISMQNADDEEKRKYKYSCSARI